MKHLLVPTDFSPNANKALEYATMLANAFGATLHILHAYTVPKPTGSLVSLAEHIEQDIRDSMQVLKDQLEEELMNKARLETHTTRGETVQAITNAARKLQADLIIMGTQGASGVKGVFVGSVAHGIMRNTDVPVIAIPEQSPFKPIKKIVFAVDELDVSTNMVIEPLLQLAQRHEAKILVFHQENPNQAKGVDPAIKFFLQDVDHSFHYELNPGNLHESLREFIRDYDADMLCMIQRKRGFFEDLFHKSATKNLSFNSPVPLLILHDKA